MTAPVPDFHDSVIPAGNTMDNRVTLQERKLTSERKNYTKT